MTTTRLRIMLNIDDAKVNLEHYEGAETVAQAVEMDGELFEAGEIPLDEFIHSYDGVVTVAYVREVKEGDDDVEVES